MKIALRIGINKYWKHLYYQGLYFWDYKNPLPYWNFLKSDYYVKKIIKGFYPFSKVEIHKTRGIIDIYICQESPANFFEIGRLKNYTASKSDTNNNETASSQREVSKESALYRVLYNLLKSRLQIFNLYTFPIHEAEILVKSLLKNHKNKEKLKSFKTLWQKGLIKGIKIKIKGRYKKSTRTKNEVYQFGQVPNTPATNLKVKLFYSSHQLLQSLGTSSLHVYLVHGK